MLHEDDKKDIIDDEDEDLNLDDDASDTDDEAEEEDDTSIEEADSSEEDETEDEDSEEEDDDEFSDEDLNDPAKRKKALEILKKHKSIAKQRAIWKDRALKSGFSKTKKEDDKSPKPQKETRKQSTQSAVQEARELNELTNFRLDHPDIPKAMVSEIKKYARANEMTLEEAMKKPLIRRFVNDKQLKERLSKASPSSRHRTPQRSAPKDWSKASAEEVAAHAAEVRRRGQQA